MNGLTVEEQKLKVMFHNNDEVISKLSPEDLAVLSFYMNKQAIDKVPIKVGEHTVLIPKVIDLLFKCNYAYGVSGEEAEHYICACTDSNSLNDVRLEEEDMADIISRAIVDEFEVPMHGMLEV